MTVKEYNDKAQKLSNLKCLVEHLPEMIADSERVRFKSLCIGGNVVETQKMLLECIDAADALAKQTLHSMQGGSK